MSRRSGARTGIIAGCGVLLAVAFAQQKATSVKPQENLDQAYAWRYQSDRKAAALDLCADVAAHPDATREQKMKAYDVACYIHSRQREYEEAIADMEAMRAALPEDQEAERVALTMEATICWNWGKLDRGLAKARELLERQPQDGLACATAHTWASRFLQRQGKHEEAYAAAATAVEQDPENHKAVADALWEMSCAAWNQGKMDDCLRALEAMLEPPTVDARTTREQFNIRRRYGEALMRAERYEDARQLFRSMEEQDTDPKSRQEWCLWQARTFAGAEKHDEALAAFERVFLEHSSVSDYWYHAQEGIVDMLRKQDRMEEAIGAARLILDASRDRNAIVRNTRTIAECLKQLDRNVGRANQMIKYQRFGPAGEDGLLGTDDDPQDPLRPLAYPSYPERERVFAAARDEAGDTAKASRHRAMTYVYTGHPEDTLRQLLDAFSRATGGDFARIGHELLVIGVRTVRGHAVDFQPYADFANFGPAGPDGKIGTDDDLADPFASLLEEATP